MVSHHMQGFGEGFFFNLESHLLQAQDVFFNNFLHLQCLVLKSLGVGVVGFSC